MGIIFLLSKRLRILPKPFINEDKTMIEQEPTQGFFETGSDYRRRLANYRREFKEQAKAQAIKNDKKIKNRLASYRTMLSDNLIKADKKIAKYYKAGRNRTPEFSQIIDLILSELLIKPLYRKSRYFKNYYENIFDCHYEENSELLVININLPNQTQIYNEKDHKLILSRNEVLVKTINEKEFVKLYDLILSQIVLLFCHSVFIIDYKNKIKFVCVNGFVEGVDKATGQKINNCVVSTSLSKENFLKINFYNVDPIKCLTSLKSRIASEFINLAPVTPIIKFNKNDKRFVKAEDVINQLSTDTNLATMEWEKFEHLVRDLFSKMFSENDAEIKVTQASRDRGVDAIVFDPDPIRGGKFIIQCKRYNNVVGVDAVRDLWGTVQHEGASKGILVTTSHYGNDSIEWVKNKPITLINGSELLHLFQKHGFNFKIEIQK